MATWNLQATYEIIGQRFGKEQMLLAKESSRSLVDRKCYALYHYREVIRLTKSFERHHLAGGELMDLLTQHGVKKREAFEVAIVKISAHALSAVQSIHSLPDILAHVAYFSTGTNLTNSRLDERAVNVQSVAAALRKEGKHATLAPVLSSTQQGQTWAHLANLANLSKHRSVVRASLNEDFTGARRNLREPHFAAFERDGKFFSGIAVTELIESENDRLSALLVAFGNQLLAELRASAA